MVGLSFEAWGTLLSALGTIGLAIIALWQLLTLQKQRNWERKFELAEALYNPLLKEIRAILDPKQTFTETIYPDPAAAGSSGASFQAWPNLKQDALHLASRVPDDLRELLDETEDLYANLKPMIGEVRRSSYEIERDLAAEYASEAGNFEGEAIDFPVYDPEGTRLGRVRLWELWIRDINLDERATELAEGNLADGYELELHSGGETAGPAEDARRLAGEGIERLGEVGYAGDVRTGIQRLRTLASRVRSRVQTELQ